MTIESAKAQVDAIWAKLDPQTQEFADWLAESLDNPALPMLTWLPGGPAKVFRIVCTVAHFDGKLVDHSLANLRFWCQQCHNRHDALARAAGRKAKLC